MEEKQFDPNGPAFAPIETEETPKPEEGEPKEENIEKVEEEARVPYKRLQVFREREREARREAAEYRERLEALEAERSRPSSPTEIPKEWFELTGGDTPEARKAYEILRNQFSPVSRDDIREEAARAYEEASRRENARMEANVQTLDEQLEDLSDVVGRELSEDEQGEILEIMDEYTAKDDDGKYLGPVFPADKAWEIREMMQKTSQAPRKQRRNEIASLTSSPSRGEPSPVDVERDKQFNPQESIQTALERRLRGQ